MMSERPFKARMTSVSGHNSSEVKVGNDLPPCTACRHRCRAITVYSSPSYRRASRWYTSTSPNRSAAGLR